MRGWGISIGAVVLLLAAVGGYTFKIHRDQIAMQQARNAIVEMLVTDWNDWVKQNPGEEQNMILKPAYPDFLLELTDTSIGNNIILDSQATSIIDSDVKKMLCDSMLAEEDAPAMESVQFYRYAKQDRISVTALYKNADGYQVYQKRFYMDECPQFEALYQRHNISS